MPLPAVVESMREALEENWGNPSSVHRLGQAARSLIERAREVVARLIDCSDRELIFTSGGTESVALALHGVLEAHPKKSAIVTSRLEHAAVRNLAERLESEGRCKVHWIQHSGTGAVDLDHLRDVLTKHAKELALVSLMSANNETGVLLPAGEVGALCREHGILFHTDATQSAGRVPFDVSLSSADLATFSAHKMHGPKGAGALFVRRGVGLSPQVVGGPQERDRRGGTENVPGIAGFAAAAEASMAWLLSADRLAMELMKNEFEKSIRSALPDAVVNGAAAPRLWNTSNIAFPQLEAEAILLALSDRGVCASAGAACSSGSLDPSPVLLAMGVPPLLAHGSIRFSLSRFTTREELAEAAAIVSSCVKKLHASTGAAVRARR